MNKYELWLFTETYRWTVGVRAAKAGQIQHISFNKNKKDQHSGY